ncbi:molybdate ABC transporter substrate-binding protein [Pelodictyon luteolum]|nr:molybdate ABC transporter substrate-binding protein [Pelodictyon luteolum]
MRKKTLFPILLFMLVAGTLHAATLTIAAGAGYKRPLMEISRLYEEKNGTHVDGVYGNMQHIITQTTMSGKVAIILGDRDCLLRSGVKTSGFHRIGGGKLVLAWRKGLKLDRASSIEGKAFGRIGMPDPSKTIYGNAATTFLQRSGLEAGTRTKLMTMSTVPQVSAYLITGELDAGFLNLTDALAIQEQIGGFMPIEQSLYEPINIGTVKVAGFENNNEARRFLEFLEKPESLAIFGKYGL